MYVQLMHYTLIKCSHTVQSCYFYYDHGFYFKIALNQTKFEVPGACIEKSLISFECHFALTGTFLWNISCT